MSERNNEKKAKADMTPISVEEKYDTVIFLIRHGQSIGNATREFLGHTDKDLSELGYKQAQRTAEFLSDKHIDSIYSSDLIRAYNTAVPHAKIRGIEIKTSRNLREMYAGKWEGMKVEDIIEKYPHEFIDEWKGDFGNATLPSGERVCDAANRMHSEIFKIANEQKGKSIIITAHAAVIRAFWGKITNTSADALAYTYDYPDNASVSVVYYDGEKLVPGEYSHSKHLADLQ